jgi:hypothetical protein
MEIVFLLEREEREETLLKSIVFNSVYGMPIKGEGAAHPGSMLQGRTPSDVQAQVLQACRTDTCLAMHSASRCNAHAKAHVSDQFQAEWQDG